jgi:hypothetical protein
VNHQDAFLRLANDARTRITEITAMELAKKRLRPLALPFVGKGFAQRDCLGFFIA